MFTNEILFTIQHVVYFIKQSRQCQKNVYYLADIAWIEPAAAQGDNPLTADL